MEDILQAGIRAFIPTVVLQKLVLEYCIKTPSIAEHVHSSSGQFVCRLCSGWGNTICRYSLIFDQELYLPIGSIGVCGSRMHGAPSVYVYVRPLVDPMPYGHGSLDSVETWNRDGRNILFCCDDMNPRCYFKVEIRAPDRLPIVAVFCCLFHAIAIERINGKSLY